MRRGGQGFLTPGHTSRPPGGGTRLTDPRWARAPVKPLRLLLALTPGPPAPPGRAAGAPAPPPRCYGAPPRDPLPPSFTPRLPPRVPPTPQDALLIPNPPCNRLEMQDVVWP